MSPNHNNPASIRRDRFPMKKITKCLAAAIVAASLFVISCGGEIEDPEEVGAGNNVGTVEQAMRAASDNYPCRYCWRSDNPDAPLPPGYCDPCRPGERTTM